MFVTVQHIIRSICLIVCLIAFSFQANGQGQTVPFTWKDSQKRVCKADLQVQLMQESTRGLFKLIFSVRWYAHDGTRIQTNSPYLYLSKYYFKLLPADLFTCITFDGPSTTDLLFQNQENLFFTCSRSGNATLSVDAQLRFALTYKDAQEGRMADIGLDGNKSLQLQFPLKVPVEEKVVSTNDAGSDGTPVLGNRENSYYQNLLLEIQRFEYRKQGFVERSRNEGLKDLTQKINEQEGGSWLSNPVKDSLQRLVNEGLRRGEITIRDLDEFIGEMETLKSGIRNDSIQDGQLAPVSGRLNNVLEEMRFIRNSYSKARYDLTGIRDQLMHTEELATSDSLVVVVRNLYLPIMGKQLDSLHILINMHHQVSEELKPFLEGPRGKSIGSTHLDSIRGLHSRVGVLQNQLKANHSETWFNYRNQMYGRGTIIEIENIHSNFTKEDIALDADIRNKEAAIQSHNLRISNPGFLASKWVLWMGSGIIVIFLAFWLMWAIRRSDRKSALTTGLPSVGLDPANTGMVSGYMVDSRGVLDPVAYEEYYHVTGNMQKPEPIITSLYIHFGVIKSIYQLVHGALMRKQPTDFGGFLFGSYYRVPQSKNQKFEVLIDKFVAAESIRSGANRTSDNGEDMVDELDNAVKQNKKYLLIGWLASSQDATMIMPDDQVKVHRNFFKEKWQMALLIHPGSENLRSALFLRRKSGFFDPIPDPSAFIRWDELYHYALNPPQLEEMQAIQMRRQADSYLQIKMTSSWSDSMISRVNLSRAVLEEVRSAVDHQDLINPGYKVSGFLYGSFESDQLKGNSGYDLFVERFIESQNGNKARELPGFRLLGWWGSGHNEIDGFLPEAAPYHEQFFKEAFHIACLENASSGEFRILSRKQNMELNNNVIETEVFNLPDLIAALRK